MKPALVAAALVASLAIVETGQALLAGGRVATSQDWEDAAAEVRAGLQPGDLVTFAPRWVDQLGRAHLGDLIPVEMAARADADRYARVWEVSIRGARAEETAGARLVKEARHGKVRVALYEKPATAVIYDFTSHAGEARVTQSFGVAAESPCFRDGTQAAFRCAGTRVEQRTLEIDFRPRRGIEVPVDGTRTTHVEWSEVPLGGTLVVYTGIHDYYARKNGDGLVDVHLSVDGNVLFAAPTTNADGWHRWTVDTRALAGTRHTVRVDVRAGDAAWRNLGFHVEARP
jgi:hypothetical protein